MKKFIIASVLILFAPLSFAVSANDIRLPQRDPTNVSTVNRDLPPSGNDELIGIGADKAPVLMRVTGGLKKQVTSGVTTLVIDSATMPVPDVAQTQMDNLQSSKATMAYADSAATAAASAVVVTWAALPDKPTLFSGAYADLSGKPVLFDGVYSSLSGIPSTFAPSAHNQAWSTITATPTTRAGYGIVDAEASGASATAQAYAIQRANHTGTQTASTITGLATVATSGAYSDIGGRPALANVATSGAYSDLSGRPSLATVATSGAYADLSGRPSIPTGTVTSITAGVGLNGGVITGSGTISVVPRSFNNTASKTLVTSATGQGGVVLDASRDAAVTYSVATSTTATIGGASSVTVYLEIATTNSATAGDWTAIQTVSNGQTITLAIVLQSVQSNTLTVSGIVPAGYYVRVRTAVAGTASATYVNGQEVKL